MNPSEQGIVHAYVKALNLKETPEGFDYAQYFPEYFSGGDKVNVLFINARTDVHSWHRMIIPGITWARGGMKVASCITNIENVRKDLNYTTVDFDIPEQLILAADIMVIPFSAEKPTDEISYMLIDAMKYARTINPQIKIVYSVEWDYYDIPMSHDAHAHFTDEVKAIVEDNILHSDYVFVPTTSLAHKIMEKVEERKFGTGPRYMVYNYYISDIELEGTSAMHPRSLSKDEEIKRIGIIMNHYDREDFAAYEKYFLAAQKKHKGKIEFVAWGHSLYSNIPDSELNNKEIGGLVEMKTGTLKKELAHRRFKFDNHLYHLKNLYNLDLDAVYFLRNESDWNKNNGLPQSILDCIILDIPVFTNMEFENFDKELVNFLDSDKAIRESFLSIIEDHEVLKDRVSNVRRSWLVQERMLNVQVADDMENVYYTMKYPQ